MTLTLIAAISRNGILGMGNELVWRHADDMRRFKGMTMGRTLIMGRKTFDSIGKPLPGRRTIVVTHDPDWSAPGVTVSHSIDDALAHAGNEVVVAGGAEIYAQTIERADHLRITHIDADFDGDVTFPPIDPRKWRPTARENKPGFSWVDYDRVPPAEAAVAESPVDDD